MLPWRVWERSGCNAWNAWRINTWSTKHITAAHLELGSLLSDEGFCGLPRFESLIKVFFFFFLAHAARQDFYSFLFTHKSICFVGLCLWLLVPFVAVRQRRKAEQAEKHLNKTKHVKNVVEKERHGQRRLSTCYFSPVLPQSSQSVKTWWEAREACIYIGSTCYDVIFPAPLLVFIIIPGPLWGSTKTIFIDSGEAYLCLMHCLYIGPQAHPCGNKQ